MYKAYELAAEKCPYPLHLGVTEAGTENMGVIKSAADIGIAGGKGCGVLFKKGEIIAKLPEAQLLDALIEEIEKM